jgi:hypothetical protein
MASITFTANDFTELADEIKRFLQQIGATVLPLQTPVQPVLTAAPGLTPIPVLPAAPTQSVPPPATVPTTAPAYTHEQLGRAVASWIDKDPNNRTKALALLQGLGVQSVTQLNTEALRSAFAVALREQGVQI